MARDDVNKLSSDIRLLGRLLGKIIEEQHDAGALALVEDIRKRAKDRRGSNGDSDSDPDAETQALIDIIAGLDLEQRRILIKAFSTYFQLINIAEDQERVRVLRRREMDSSLNESLDDAIRTLHDAGLTAEQVQHILDHLRVRLVLTAHPSEAKRKELLLKMREIAAMIDLGDRQALSPREQRIFEATMKEEIEELWQTRPTRATRTSVADEVDFGLYFITSVIMDVAIDIYGDLEHALEEHYPNADWSNPPAVLRYGSWIGGDRDGNPNVTSDVTLETLETLRRAAHQVYIAEITTFREHLTQATTEVGVSARLIEAVNRQRTLPSPLQNTILVTDDKYPGELYRQHMDNILAKLHSNSYKDSRELLADLLIVDESLRENKGLRVAKGSLLRLIRKVRLFGLHLVPLDIREDARLQAQTIHELFQYYGICDDYLALPESEKQALLTREIGNARPFFPAHVEDFSETTQRVVATWRMIAEAHKKYSPIVIDSVIASMSQQPSDMLTMLLMAHEVRIQDDVDIVPLFETIDDLVRGPEIIAAVFDNPKYRAHMEARGVRRGLRQQIMIGYSDSSKDGGYLASNWNLYTAQKKLTEVCESRGISLQLFHGRGGSIGRGGGPTNRSILAQPPLSLRGGIKITEQGEVIAYRYGNPDIARRHLHQIMHASLIAMGLPMETEIDPKWQAAMETMVAAGQRAYRNLVYDTPGFLDYWQQATPLNELARLPISSRPARRSSKLTLDSIRAIPWVFSWMQSRAIIPSWYGVGTAIQTLMRQNDHALSILQDMYHRWPFFNALIQNLQLDVAKADMGIAELYASLVKEDDLRESIFGRIRTEHELTTRMVCEILDQHDILDNVPVMKRSIEGRNPYVDPLNFIQVALMRDLRAAEPDSPEYEAALDAVLATINGIAAGMKTTG